MRLLRHPRRQRGVAVVTALLLTTLAISIVASLFWQQQVQVRSMENQRLQLQTKWIQRGALDWASVILRQPFGGRISLDQIWATPLAETRLDQYIERERVQGENFNASLSGQVYDATARYNLNNLAAGGKRDSVETEVLRRLLTNVRQEPRLARPIADFVAAGQALAQEQDDADNTAQTPRKGNPMPVLRVDDLLAVQGVKPETVEALRPFVIVLPAQATTVNVNTAPAEVLAAVLPGCSISQANAMVEQRKRIPWNDVAMFENELQCKSEAPERPKISTTSNYFLVQSRIRLDRAALDAESLVQKGSLTNVGPAGGVSVIWTRQN
ncbi:type II secretion system minor pseudopilin GspK [Massilia sp. CFBP9026]|uniref:type II secretion system minor pseudopilin GspK n=1 Tax=Massilia sp. CFBP9026 TaxID=3096536 RepID=UPI002A6B85D3|nr:type II secretion system minor pseudopilin GspK [Massilia sp. CFBP9026]MDY0963471.1 type II secretion system minor pseudopilin GspK [Massilia sp. CFBP9026]